MLLVLVMVLVMMRLEGLLELGEEVGVSSGVDLSRRGVARRGG
jgi:hypothetical protein